MRARSVGVVTLLFLIATGCDGLLEVEDSRSFREVDLREPEAAELLANGALLGAQEGWDGAQLLLATASDELFWYGPHGWWQSPDEGDLSDDRNTALTRGYGPLASGWWVVEQANHILDSLAAAGESIDEALVARAHLYGAIVNPILGDVLEEFGPTDPTIPQPPISAADMPSLYDRAVAHASSGERVAPTDPLRRDLLAARARARHARSVRERLFPIPADTTSGGLIANADAAQDALASLAIDGSDWRFEFTFSEDLDLRSRVAGEVCGGIPNLRFSSELVFATPPALFADSVRMLDPLDGVPDPWVGEVALTQVARPDCVSPTLTVFSAREMHLIVAEDALARADTVTFASHLNSVRSMVGLTPWSVASGVSARDMLIHERRTKLLFTGRRLADMYRFGIRSPTWRAGSDAVERPGSLFPIPAVEVALNCRLNRTC